MSACECHKKCSLPQFKSYPVGVTGELLPEYYSSHLNVGNVDDFYHLPLCAEEGGNSAQQNCPVHVLRVISSSGGRALIDVDHLAGNMGQVQLNIVGSWVKLIYKCCIWHVADGEQFTCV